MQANVRIELDTERCIRCKTCIRVCYQNVYRWDKEKQEVIPAFVEDCVSCVMCAQNCPKQCIEIVPTAVHRFDPLEGE